MSTSAFHRFPALPPELRFLIWEAALSVPAVWAAVRVLPGEAASDGADSNMRAFRMSFVGPTPLAAGLSCKEAWRLLKQSYVKQICGPADSTVKTLPYWVNMNHIVVYLGNSLDAMDILESFDADTLYKFRHVALAWHISQFYPLARACQRLATVCPALCTIIIQFCERVPGGGTRGSAEPLERPVTLKRAAYYAEILAYTGPQLDCRMLDSTYFRAQLLQYFGGSPPKLHCFTPDSGRGLP